MSDPRAKDDPSKPLTPLQVALGLGVAAGAWMVAELLRRLM